MKVIAFAFCVCMALVSHAGGSAATRDVGLVLGGGGGKGAYEVGVWRAMCEVGLDGRIGAISGTSVGAINAALFATAQDPSRCEAVWLESIGDAFKVNVGAILKRFAKNLPDGDTSPDGIYATDGGLLSRSALRDMLDKGLSVWPPTSPIALYTTAMAKEDGQRKVFRIDGATREVAVDRILASATMPVAFMSVDIDGVKYMDGGYVDNVPLAPLLENDTECRLKTIIVVRLSDRGAVDKSRTGGRRIVEIVPSEDLSLKIGGNDYSWLDVRPDHVRHLLKLGHEDAMKALKDNLPKPEIDS